MPTTRLALGTDDTPSAEFTVAANEYLTVGLFGPTPPAIPYDAKVRMQLKDAGDEFWNFGVLTGDSPGAVLSAGTWRFVRSASSAECGVFSG